MMRIATVSIACLLASMFGCFKPAPPSYPITGALTAELTGIIAEEVSTNGLGTPTARYGNADGARTTIDTKSIRVSLVDGELLNTNQYPRVEISRLVAGKSHHYEVVFGPNFGASLRADGQVTTEADGTPCFLVDNGWAIFWGRFPMPYTNLVNASSTTTTILVRDVSPTLHQVFMLHGSQVDVECKIGTSKEPIISLGYKEKGMYVEVTSGSAGCNVGDPKNVFDRNDDTGDPNDIEIEDFVKKAVTIAKAAGLPASDVPGW